MTCIIIDDDAMACRSLEIYCGRIPALKVVSVCVSADQAAKAVALYQPDLLFVDVEMPDKTGLELLDGLTTLPQVIMTTGKADYAFAAFNYNVTDYLKKPIIFPRFKTAVEKALVLYNSQKPQVLEEKVYIPPSVSTAFTSNHDAFFFRTEGRYVRLMANDVLYFENIGDYVKVCTKTNCLTIYSTMKNLDEKLKHPSFVKVHRSYIINITKIVDIEENSLVIERKVIPISRAHKAFLMSKLIVI